MDAAKRGNLNVNLKTRYTKSSFLRYSKGGLKNGKYLQNQGRIKVVPCMAVQEGLLKMMMIEKFSNGLSLLSVPNCSTRCQYNILKVLF